MEYKVFYRKYRPKNFNELIGQDNIKNILTSSIKLGRIAHAYIFTGPRGTGKTSTAKIFAKTLNCINNEQGISCNQCELCESYVESADIIEIDAASNNGVDEIRTLRESVKVAPYNSKYKVYIIDEVHMLSNSAWNALLKTLEEPPKHVIFILATTEINKIPETVMSRCQRFDFTKIDSQLMFNHLSKICKEENIDITNDALQEIVKLSNGCLRDALSFLDQISKYTCKIDVNLIENNFGILSICKMEMLYNFIISNDKKNINLKIDEIMNSGITPVNFINEYVNYLLNLVIENKINDQQHILFIKELIYRLNSILLEFNTTVNMFTLIKVELITLNYFPGNNNVNISQEKIEEKTTEEAKKIKLEKVKEKKSNVITIFNDKIKNVRINNAFVNPSKILKQDFINNWNNFLNKLNIENQYNLLGYIENGVIEVVSEKNVILSFKSLNEAIIFNQNLDEIENNFKKITNNLINFIALSNDEWENERKKYIENKEKNYKYIDETNENIIQDIKTKDIANDIFGDEIIEIR